jgi:hypothetical protein
MMRPIPQLRRETTQKGCLSRREAAPQPDMHSIPANPVRVAG